MINSNVFFYEEKIFYINSVVLFKNPDGIVEKFKISNPNKSFAMINLTLGKRAHKVMNLLLLKYIPNPQKFILMVLFLYLIKITEHIYV